MSGTYSPKIVLYCPTGHHMGLDALVEDFIAAGVHFVGVVGKDCNFIEDLIDELVVGWGTDDQRFILTSAHPDESVDDVMAFARTLSSEIPDFPGRMLDGEPQVVVLTAQGSITLVP